MPSTDEWPFLPLEQREVPPVMLVISGAILALSVAMALLMRPRGERFDGRVFWLGAAFMLVEVHNVSRLALLFGTTWQVNAWVIAAIMAVIFLANLICTVMRRRQVRGGAWVAVALFVSLAASWLAPLDAMLSWSHIAGGGFASLLLTAPIFFAGLLFADAFADSPSPGFSLGWNTLGAVVGGMAENISYLVGIPSLVLLAAVFYALALLWPVRGQTSTS